MKRCKNVYSKGRKRRAWNKGTRKNVSKENICLKQIKDHIITRVNGWKNMKIPDGTIVELLTKLMLTVLFQIILVIHPMKKSYNPVTKIPSKHFNVS